MTTYYRDDAVRITDAVIEVGMHKFPVSELRFVWHQRGKPTLRTAYRRAARIGLIAVFTVPVVVGAVLLANVVVATEYGLVAQTAVAALLVVVGVLVLFLLAPVLEFPLMALERSYDRGTEVREIWIRWHEHDLLLLRTADSARFGKIYRAIQRAIEVDEG